MIRWWRSPLLRGGAGSLTGLGILATLASLSSSARSGSGARRPCRAHLVPAELDPG